MRVYPIHIHVHAHGPNTLADNEKTLTKQTYHLIELVLSFIDSFPIVTVHHKYQSLKPTSGACECVLSKHLHNMKISDRLHITSTKHNQEDSNH